MRIVVLCNYDVASNYALNLLLPRLVPKHRVSVLYSSRVGGRGPETEELAQLQFFEQTLFNQLLFPALAKGQTGGELLSFQGLAEAHGVAIEVFNSINSSSGLQRLEAEGPDLILSIRYGRILKRRAIAIARWGVLNLHSGRLPTYRGVMATFRAMLAGDSHVGATVHTIEDAGIDTGEIFGIVDVAVDYDRSYWWNVLQLYPPGVELLVSAVERLAEYGVLSLTRQATDAAYFSFPDRRELDDFSARGHRLFDVDEVSAYSRRFVDGVER